MTLRTKIFGIELGLAEPLRHHNPTTPNPVMMRSNKETPNNYGTNSLTNTKTTDQSRLVKAWVILIFGGD